ncbi:MAG: hypothetical protein AB7G28_04190 [Pirellulales bacterium]
MNLLVQFLLRLTFGLAFGMAVTSPRLVSSGYFRNHLYVTLGLATLSALVSMNLSTPVAVLSAVAAVLSYAGSVAWLYEAKRAGVVTLWLVVGVSLAAALLGQGGGPLEMASVVTSGLLLGLTFAAMLLGHWYLNSPGMELEPLRRLLVFMAAAVIAQMVVSGLGLVWVDKATAPPAVGWWLFVLLRWSFGLLGVLGLVWMAWQTLKIPNTQSATGILYVAVIGVFVGELTGLLLSAESAVPL